MDETQAIKTLLRIEKLLEQSLAAGKLEESEKRIAVRRKVGKKSDETPDFTNLNKQAIRATVRIKMLAEESEKLGNTSRKTRADLISLRTGIRSATSTTATSFSGLNTVLNSVTRSSTLTAAATDVNTQIRQQDTEAIESGTDATRRQTHEVNQSSQKMGLLSGMLGRFGVHIGQAGDSSEWLRGQFVNLGWSLGDAAINVTRDLYYLQARGISAGDSLFELYGNAMKAGMSLQEYGQLLEDNAAAVVRATSFSEFGDSIDRTTRQLNRLGVFGPAAEQLAASLRTNSIVLGVSQDQQEAAINAQLKIYAQLRKTTLMASSAFRELVTDLANNQVVQEELLGLAPAERAARMEQIVQGATIGQRLGATAQASKALTDALLAQRKAGTVDRFKAAGMARMAGSQLGISSEDANRFAQLSMKKVLNENEKEEMARLAGVYEQRIQEAYNSNDLTRIFIAEQLQELMPAQQRQAMEAAGAIKLQAEAGKPQNAEVGQETSALMQDVGQALTVLSGFMKNPLADSMVIFGSILAQSLMQNFWLKRIAANTNRNSVAQTGVLSRIFGKKGAAAAGGGIMATFGQFMAETLGSAMSIDITGRRAPGEIREKGIGARIAKQNEEAAAKKLVAKEKGLKGMLNRMLGLDALGAIALNLTEADLGMGNVGTETKVPLMKKLKGLLSKTFSFLGKGGLVAMAFGAIEELFTGDFGAGIGLGDGFGDRLMGAVLAGINSFFTGFTRIIDGGFNWVMEGLGFSVRSNITKVVDYASLVVVDTFREFGRAIETSWLGVKASFFNMLADLLDAIPGVSGDAPWVKGLRNSAADALKAQAAAEANKTKLEAEEAARRQQLWDTEGATLRSMGEEQIRAQKATADKSKALTKTMQDNVTWGIQNLGEEAKRTAAAMSTLPAAAQQPTIATPQPQPQPKVTQPEVNTAQVEADKRKDRAAVDGATITVVGMQELISMTQQQLDVLKQMLAAATTTEAQKTVEPLAKARFTDAASMYNSIIAA